MWRTLPPFWLPKVFWDFIFLREQLVYSLIKKVCVSIALMHAFKILGANVLCCQIIFSSVKSELTCCLWSLVRMCSWLPTAHHGRYHHLHTGHLHHTVMEDSPTWRRRDSKALPQSMLRTAVRCFVVFALPLQTNKKVDIWVLTGTEALCSPLGRYRCTCWVRPDRCLHVHTRDARIRRNPHRRACQHIRRDTDTQSLLSSPYSFHAHRAESHSHQCLFHTALPPSPGHTHSRIY